jgi:hypothetical protein
MAGTHIHFLINTLVWGLLYFIWIFIPFQWLSWIFADISLISSYFQFSLGGIIYDLDHFLYYGITTKPRTIAKIKERMTIDYAESNPHFYVCHTIEFILIILVIAFYFESSLLLISLSGWIVHMIIDSFGYIALYKSHLPWLPYFSFISYFISKKRHTIES